MINRLPLSIQSYKNYLDIEILSDMIFLAIIHIKLVMRSSKGLLNFL